VPSSDQPPLFRAAPGAYVSLAPAIGRRVLPVKEGL
jgi:hypothetical protein